MNIHKIRSSRVRNIIVEEYPYFIAEIKQKDQINTRIVSKDFSILHVIRLLECLQNKDESFNDFLLKSGFGHKRSFLNYLNLCLEFNFIEKDQLGHKMYYRLMERGKIFLDLFEK